MTELQAAMAEVHALRAIRAELETKLAREVVQRKVWHDRAYELTDQVTTLTNHLHTAREGLTGEPAALVDRVNDLWSELKREKAKFAILAEFMPTFLTDFIATYSPFNPEALTPEYRKYLQTAHDYLKILEPFGGQS